LDCHPINHCSFKENGGQWPIHCVSYTVGAGLPVEFLEKAKSSSFQPKGMIVEQEEYGAFNSFMELMLDLDYDNKLNFNLHNTPEIIKNTVVNNIDEFVICGIAGDYCVVETLKNIVKHIGNDKVSVFLDGVVSIDDGTTLNTYMKENNIKTYKD
jgi:nicotinamidase-related amidase